MSNQQRSELPVVVLPPRGVYECRCRHYTGRGAGTCAAGVRYDEVEVTHSPPIPYRRENNDLVLNHARSLPCVPVHNFGGVAKCVHQDLVSAEEMEAEDRECQQILERIGQAREAIVKHSGGRRGTRGQLLCPVCSRGRLDYRIMASNAHVHARCSTPDCVAWVE